MAVSVSLQSCLFRCSPRLSGVMKEGLIRYISHVRFNRRPTGREVDKVDMVVFFDVRP